ncbi:phage holin family protein [Micrococcales bacterium 31B]|nr:phage holin family protein [Micrococcales bacterium 31B]
MSFAQNTKNSSSREDQQRADFAAPKRSVGELVTGIVAELGGIVQRQIDLAKAELKTAAIKGGIGAAGFIAAGLFLFFALIMLLFAGAYGFVAAGLPAWGAFLLVAGILIVIAIIVAVVGLIFFKKVRGPERTIAQAQRTIKVVQGKGHLPTTTKAEEYNEVYKDLYGTDAK